jgi:uncharacterized protein YbjT (DUF2867 family)
MKIAIAGATGRVGHYTVEELNNRGQNTVAISRSNGVDIITGEGLKHALSGVDCIIDAASNPSPDQESATKFFTTAARNLQEFGSQAGVKQIIVVSIIGIDRFTSGYMVAKIAHEKVSQSGRIPASIVRAAQFHEFVSQMMEWGMKDKVSYIPKMRTQLVAARTVAEFLADIATGNRSVTPPFVEIAGPKMENLVDAAKRLIARRGDQIQIEGVSDPADPDRVLYETDGLLPSRDAILAGPTFDEWLDSEDFRKHSN